MPPAYSDWKFETNDFIITIEIWPENETAVECFQNSDHKNSKLLFFVKKKTVLVFYYKN